MAERRQKSRLRGAPKKHGSHRDHRTCTNHDNPVLYAPAGHEVRAGQRLSIPGRQSYLHERLPIGKLPQPGSYTGPYCPNAHNQREQKRRGVSRRCPNPLSRHTLGSLPQRRTGVLTQRPTKRRGVACPTGAHRHRPHIPRSHQDRRLQPSRTGGWQERQKKLKLRTTNERSNCVTQFDR